MGIGKYLITYLAIGLCLHVLCGCTGPSGKPIAPTGERRTGLSATSSAETRAETHHLGPPVAATQPDLAGDREHDEAIALMGRLVAKNPTARTITVRASVVSGVEKRPYRLSWEYDRERGRFVYCQEDSAGATTEYRYSKVTDAILVDLGRRATQEFVDFSSLHGLGCPYELANDGKVVLSEP